jgi:hypothetical protein
VSPGIFHKIRLFIAFWEARKRSFWRGAGQAGKGGWVENRVEDGALAPGTRFKCCGMTKGLAMLGWLDSNIE